MDLEPRVVAGPSYDGDTAGWAEHQAALLRAGRLAELDIENVAEEIESVGRSEQKELTSRLIVLIAHLLKWQFQPSRRGSSWQDTISTQRVQIARHMKRNPSLKAKLDDAVEDGHADARLVARMETGLEPEVFPLKCPYTWPQIMDDRFLPG